MTVGSTAASGRTRLSQPPNKAASQPAVSRSPWLEGTGPIGVDSKRASSCASLLASTTRRWIPTRAHTNDDAIHHGESPANPTAAVENIRTPSTGAASSATVVEESLNGTRNFRLVEAFHAKNQRARREANA